jgi:hypothetical protein
MVSDNEEKIGKFKQFYKSQFGYQIDVNLEKVSRVHLLFLVHIHSHDNISSPNRIHNSDLGIRILTILSKTGRNFEKNFFFNIKK